MRLTKREQLLLSLLAILLLGFVFFRFALLPLREGIAEEQAQLVQLRNRKQQVDSLLFDESLAENYQQSLEQAAKYYDAFYTPLNSYTVDTILNGLMDDKGLHVRKLQISPYQPVEDSAILPEGKSGVSGDRLLLLSLVDLTASGRYDQILAFLDALNEKSFCVQVERTLLTAIKPNEYGDTWEISATLRVYGIETPGADPI